MSDATQTAASVSRHAASDFCRACGTASQGERACSNCAAPLHVDVRGVSRVGMVVTQRRRLRSDRRGLVVDDLGTEIVVHFSAKETIPVPAGDASIADESPGLSPAGRWFWHARDGRQHHPEWDLSAVGLASWPTVVSDIGASRALLSEAADYRWDDVVDALPLTYSEKAWTMAHAASSRADLPALRVALDRLPVHGYPTRVALLVPHAAAVADAMAEWRPLLTSWVSSGFEGAGDLLDLVDEDWAAGLAAASRLLAGRDVGRAGHWSELRDSFAHGDPPPPSSEGSPAWAALSLYVRGRAGVSLDDRLRHLELVAPPLVDDLVDCGALTSGVDVTGAPVTLADQVLRRLAPHRLSEAALEKYGMHGERARRMVADGRVEELAQLPPDRDVLHFRAVADLRHGRPASMEHLRPETRAVIDEVLAFRERARRAPGAVTPETVLNDPSTWALLTDVARTGAVIPGDWQRSTHPEYSRWCDLQRSLGLLWDGLPSSALASAQRVLEGDPRSDQRAEALSLSALSALQLGQHGEALRSLEQAIEAELDDVLLVNAMIVAEVDEPRKALAFCMRLLGGDLDADTRRVAVDAAVRQWNALPDPTLPDGLAVQIVVVLREPSDPDQYLDLVRILTRFAPDTVLTLSPPNAVLKGVVATQLAHVRFSQDDSFGTDDLAQAFIDVSNDVGRPSWFEREWEDLCERLRKATAVDFGKGMGAATFWDTVLVGKPELLDAFDRIFMAPQAGAHMAVHFAERDAWLSEGAIEKFFTRPATLLKAQDHGLTEAAVDGLAANLARCATLAAIQLADTARRAGADEYNGLLQQLRSGAADPSRVRRKMLESLDDSTRAAGQVSRLVQIVRSLPGSPGDADVLRSLMQDVDQWRAEDARLRGNW